MNVEDLYGQIARYIQDGLNSTSEVYEFSLRTIYDEQAPENPNVISGTLAYTPSDIIPIANISVMTLNGSVDFVCKKDVAAEIVAVIQSWLETQKGVVSTIGNYSCMPSYETPTRSNIGLVGQLGESVTVSFFGSWVMVEGGILENSCPVLLDDIQLPVLTSSLAKVKNVLSDNKANVPVLQGQAVTQSLAFEYTAYLTSAFSGLISEIMAVDTDSLQQTHTLSVTIGENVQEYTVVLSSGQITGAAGGVKMCQISFVLAVPTTG